jgi:Zn-dependent oligopeptidase
MTIQIEVRKFIETFNHAYEAKHKAYEDNFWSTKMNLKGNSITELTRTKSELDEFLGDEKMLLRVQEYLKVNGLDTQDLKALQCFEKTFKCYIVQDESARKLKNRIDQLESELQQSRNKMKLGYTVNDEFKEASSVQLRNLMNTNSDVNVRKAAYEGLCSIGPFVAERFCEIVKLRNQFARKLGYKCFYDMKVNQAEGFDKETLFKILDGLLERARPLITKAREKLCKEKGEDALLPFNLSYSMSGDLNQLKNPYFPFENAVDCWARSFAALGISYEGATMQLDLCDRAGKYSNGFCHWPQPAWVSSKGWIPSRANFTSLATPSAVGSGYTALVTLMHEGGHAAHFANIKQHSPLYSQERAPTSVAYAENQSMFLDSLVGDAAWLSRYAKNDKGEIIPWELIERTIRETHEYKVFALGAMLAVPMFERRLYELEEADITPENIMELANQIEMQVQGGFSPRPLMSVPHILSDESAAYYHGYVLAEMSVHQTRDFFLKKYGSIVDNPSIGRDLTEFYWKSGNSEKFLDLVKNLTGKPLSGDAWVDSLKVGNEELLTTEKIVYEDGLVKGPTFKPGDEVDLNMRVKFVHGDDLIADSQTHGLRAACTLYKTWVKNF